MVVKCKKCGLPLTHALTALQSKDGLSEIDNRDYIKPGFYFISDGGYYAETSGKIIVNKDDLINVKDHADPGRLNGCCGLDGMDGPDKTCMNGHEIASAYTDCWMPHCVIFEPDRVRLETGRSDDRNPDMG